MEQPYISVSLMCMDLMHADEQLQSLNHHFEGLHFDVMDGHYCKNFALTPAFLRAVRSRSMLPIDAHLMMTNPNDFLDEIAHAGASSISVHAETIHTDAFRTLNHIHELGCQTGLVLNPATTLFSALPILSRVDILTIMTVDIGFAGQAFIWEMLDKIRQAKELREAHGWHYHIQIDGGCRKDYYKALHDAGADRYIVGNAGFFSLGPNLEAAADKMRAQFREAVYGGSQ